jgi:hypothetical protein
MHMPFVNMRRDNVLVFSLQGFIGEPLPNLVRLFGRGLARLERLYQMMREVVAFVERF